MCTHCSHQDFIPSENIRKGAEVIQKFYQADLKRREHVEAVCFSILESKGDMTQYKLVRALVKKAQVTNGMAASVVRELRSEGKLREDMHSCLISLV